MHSQRERLPGETSVSLAFLELAKDLFCICQGTTIQWINAKGLSLLRFNAMDDALGRRITDFILEDYAEVFADGLALVADEPNGLPLRMMTVDGHALDVVFFVTFLTESDSPAGLEGPCFLVECRDISDQVKTFREARWRERRLNAILKTVDLAVISINSFGIIESANAAAATMFGFPLTGLVGENVSMLMPEPDASRHNDYIMAYHAAGKKKVLGKTREVVARRADGTLFPVELTVIEQTESADFRVFIGIIRDVTLIREQQARIHFLAMNDALTSLPNRACFNERLDLAVADEAPFALLFIDLDHFKPINDTYGHEAGDEVLRVVAKRLLGLVTESDTVARLGGDEFVILLTQGAGCQGAEVIAQGILDALTVPIPVGPADCTVGASIGLSLYPQDGTTVTDLLSAADHAMYAAKKSGRNCYATATAAPSL